MYHLPIIGLQRLQPNRPLSTWIIFLSCILPVPGQEKLLMLFKLLYNFRFRGKIHTLLVHIHP